LSERCGRVAGDRAVTVMGVAIVRFGDYLRVSASWSIWELVLLTLDLLWKFLSTLPDGIRIGRTARVIWPLPDREGGVPVLALEGVHTLGFSFHATATCNHQGCSQRCFPAPTPLPLGCLQLYLKSHTECWGEMER
jgi:hypothetical protein